MAESSSLGLGDSSAAGEDTWQVATAARVIALDVTWANQCPPRPRRPVWRRTLKEGNASAVQVAGGCPWRQCGGALEVQVFVAGSSRATG